MAIEKERELEKVNEGTILVVDDDTLSRRYMRDLLVGEGFSVIDIDDPRRVGNILKEREIDVVILDLNLPFMKGTEVLYEIKKDIFLKHVPVIIVSTENEVLERIKSMYSGADDYIVKPVEGGEFLTRVKVVLRRSRQDLDVNPLTKFPGNVSIQREIDKLIKKKTPFAVGYVDLDKFKELMIIMDLSAVTKL
ncbi:MAG: response regulator transcription factor [Candidatus Omnitrophica bacterium]|nr:response regulator transcription factor [Candidatus Omnitrophota bacterium]